MPIVNINKAQAGILDKVFDRGHDVLYSGVSAPGRPAYMPVNQDYKNIIDSPPPNAPPPAQMELDTKNGTRTAVAALVATITPNIAVHTASTTSVVTLATPLVLVSGTIPVDSPNRALLVMFNGTATASAADTVTLRLVAAGLPLAAYSFVVATSRTAVYGSWVVNIPTPGNPLIQVTASTAGTNTFTFASADNQILTIYG